MGRILPKSMKNVEHTSETPYSVWLHSLSSEEIQKQLEQLNKQHSDILSLPTEEFLSDKNTILLKDVHNRVLELVQEINRR